MARNTMCLKARLSLHQSSGDSDAARCWYASAANSGGGACMRHLGCPSAVDGDHLLWYP